MNTELGLHISEELEDDTEYDHLDLIETLRDNRAEIQTQLKALQSDIDTTIALENLHTFIIKREFITMDDVEKYNLIANMNNGITFTNYKGDSCKVITLESFDTLLTTGSIIANTASNVSNKAVVAALAIKEGAVAGAQFAKFLYEKVQSSIVKIAASWDMVCSLLEKRWLGLKQLIQVYDLQQEKLLDKFQAVEAKEDALGFFKVKLYVAKLRNDGRDISKKDTLVNAITEDSQGIYQLCESFINSISEMKKVDAVASQAFKLQYPYKKALALNCNIVNEALKNLADNPIFKSGGFIKDYQAQSRVLVGGKVVYINYNAGNLATENTRKETRSFISNMNFSAIKRRDGTNNETETVEFSALTVDQARSIFQAVQKTNDALRLYHESRIPAYFKDRTTVSDLIRFATGVTGGNSAFDTIKRFFNNDDNLRAFNLVAPVPVAKLLATFLGASSFAVFSGIVAAAAATYLLDYLRKYLVANIFSMMDLQYKVTNILEQFDHDWIDALIEVHNQGYRVCKKLASTRNWEL